jgi:hypothetical protein
MRIVARVGAAVQQLFGAVAEEVAAECGVIQRKRKFTAQSLARTFVMGHFLNPRASDEELAQTASLCGSDVTPQAVEQRYTPQLVQFLEGLVRRAMGTIIGTDTALAPLLERFTSVTLLDSSTVTLPDSAQDRFPGCGGSYDSGAAAIKLQTELELRRGELLIQIEKGRSPDCATSRQHAERAAGSLRINDLGYFSLPAFADTVAQQAHFLSRLLFGTVVFTAAGVRIDDLLLFLSQQPGGVVDMLILLGKDERLPCRLVAWRLPPEQAQRRRQKLRQSTRRKRGREPSAASLAWCDWTILVTSVPPEMMSVQEGIVLYRSRWQIELLFKRWKSQNLLAEMKGDNHVRQMARFWARLLVCIVQHWLVTAGGWGDPLRSLWKLSKAVREFVNNILLSLDNAQELERVLERMCQALAHTCRRNARGSPGTFELLNNPELLEFRFPES